MQEKLIIIEDGDELTLSSESGGFTFQTPEHTIEIRCPKIKIMTPEADISWIHHLLKYIWYRLIARWRRRPIKFVVTD